MDKYDRLRKANTNGANFDLDTDAVIAHLKEWDKSYGIELGEVAFDAVTVMFQKLPKDVSALAADIYEFCPDTIDQHFGCVAEMLSLAEETDQEVPPEMLELVEGVDLEDDDYGMELLKRSLTKTRTVALWWD